MNVLIIGIGLIGGSIAIDLRRRGFANHITGVDNNKNNAIKALELGIVDKITSLDDALTEADLIITATPVHRLKEIIQYALEKMKPNAIITDVGSTKLDICKHLEKHPNRKSYVASHPMAGTENSGPQSALKDLFNDKTSIICDWEKSSPEAIHLIERMYKVLGMRIVYMNSKEHDYHAAFVSHLSHITSFALANAVLEKEKDRTTIFDLAGGGFHSTARLAKSSPDMWAPIFSQNKNNICEALDLYIKHIKLFKKSIEDDNKEDYIKLMKNANSIRRILSNISN